MGALKFIGGYMLAGAVVGTVAHATVGYFGYKAGARQQKKLNTTAEKQAK